MFLLSVKEQLFCVWIFTSILEAKTQKHSFKIKLYYYVVNLNQACLLSNFHFSYIKRLKILTVKLVPLRIHLSEPSIYLLIIVTTFLKCSLFMTHCACYINYDISFYTIEKVPIIFLA